MTSQAKLRHIVMFAFKPEATARDINGVIDRFRALEDLVPGVESFECGGNVSPEGLSRGFTHVFQLTFGSDAARDAYLPHPQHRAFVTSIEPYVKEALVLDYWAS